MAENQVPQVILDNLPKDFRENYAYIPIADVSRNKNELLYMAKLAKESRRFKEMVKIMEKIVNELSPPDELTVEERDLFAVAHKTYFFILQTAWLKVSQVAESYNHVASRYTSFIEMEILKLCVNIRALLKDKLETSASTSESKVYYLTLRADFNKHLVRFKQGYELEKVKAEALETYQKAKEISVSNLDPADPTRLRLFLSFSAFYKDVLHSPPEALSTAREAYDLAKTRLADMKGKALRERKVIVERLRDFFELLLHDQDMERD